MKYAIVLVFTMIFFQKVEAMSFFSVGKTCVFSEVKVRLLLNGKPVSNVEVTRQWEWNKLNSDNKTTDAQGYVSFPAVFESSVSRLLPVELVVGQQLSIQLEGKEKVFWTNSKREPEENAEYGGKKFNAVCELASEEILIEDYGSLMVTMCQLENEE